MISSKGSDHSIGHFGLLGMRAKPSSVGQGAMATTHEGWLSAQTITPGWPMGERSWVEPHGERLDHGKSALRIEREEQRFGVDAKSHEDVGSLV